MTIACFTGTNHLQLVLNARKKYIYTYLKYFHLRSVSYKTVSIIYNSVYLRRQNKGAGADSSLTHNFEAHYLLLVLLS